MKLHPEPLSFRWRRLKNSVILKNTSKTEQLLSHLEIISEEKCVMSEPCWDELERSEDSVSHLGHRKQNRFVEFLDQRGVRNTDVFVIGFACQPIEPSLQGQIKNLLIKSREKIQLFVKLFSISSSISPSLPKLYELIRISCQFSQSFWAARCWLSNGGNEEYPEISSDDSLQ